MRGFIVTGCEYVYLKYFFATFLPNLKGSHQFELFKVPMVGGFSDALRRIVSFPQYFVPLVFKEAYARLSSSSQSIEGICSRYQILCHSLNSVSSDLFFNKISEVKPDILISIGCPQIFPQRLLDTSGMLSINFHAGYLPKYRGCLVPFWALLNGDPIVLSWHVMTSKVDAGPVIFEKPLQFSPGDSLHTISIKILEQSAHMLAEGIDTIFVQKRRMINHREGQYFDWPTWKDGIKFKKKGLSLW